MVIVGLTGSIGMGKTAAAEDFRSLGVPVFDSDRVVHRLLAGDGETVARIEAAFPGVAKDGAVDREALARRVFDDADALSRLEAVLHPEVRRRQRRFLADAAAEGRRLVVLDVPLLFETGGERRCDAVVVVSAPREVQEERVLGRPGMTRERLESILSRQVPDGEKRRRADFVVETGQGREISLRAIENIVKVAGRRRGTRWPRSWEDDDHA